MTHLTVRLSTRLGCILDGWTPLEFAQAILTGEVELADGDQITIEAENETGPHNWDEVDQQHC
jgi:hypothetical protein